MEKAGECIGDDERAGKGPLKMWKGGCQESGGTVRIL